MKIFVLWITRRNYEFLNILILNFVINLLDFFHKVATVLKNVFVRKISPICLVLYAYRLKLKFQTDE